MIVQACINGSRPPSFHPALPLTPSAIAADAVACIKAGAAEIHVHPRRTDGSQSLGPETIDPAIAALRAALPGTAIGVSTGVWIERDDARRLACIDAWQVLPDYASVNLAEADAPAVIERLLARGIGVEAGIATLADAERLLATGYGPRCLRLLVEIRDQTWAEALAVSERVEATLAPLRRPILLHGFDAMMWNFVRRAASRRYSTRVGLEDGAPGPDEHLTPGNAELVASAVRIMRES